MHCCELSEITYWILKKAFIKTFNKKIDSLHNICLCGVFFMVIWVLCSYWNCTEVNAKALAHRDSANVKWYKLVTYEGPWLGWWVRSKYAAHHVLEKSYSRENENVSRRQKPSTILSCSVKCTHPCKHTHTQTCDRALAMTRKEHKIMKKGQDRKGGCKSGVMWSFWQNQIGISVNHHRLGSARLCPLTLPSRPGPLPWDPGSVQTR